MSMEPYQIKGRPGWYYKFKDPSRPPGRQWVERGGASVRTLKEAYLAQSRAETRARRIHEGEIDPRQEEMRHRAARPIAEWIAEYQRHLSVEKLDNRHHVRVTINAIRAIVKHLGVRSMQDFDTAWATQGVSDFLADVLERGRSRRTRNHYLISVRGMLQWAHRKRRALHSNPLDVIDKLDEQAGERRQKSRAMEPHEFHRLIAALPNTDAGKARRTYYLLAATLGIRWREIARLRWGDVDLHHGILTLEASNTKNKRRDDLPLTAGLVQALDGIRPPMAGMTEPIFQREPRLSTWKDDLLRAGLIQGKHIWTRTRGGVEYQKLIITGGYRDARGRILDRKSLRLTCGTLLHQAGVSLVDAQRILRHSDPKLTAIVYMDVRLPNLTAAVESMPDLSTPPAPANQASTAMRKRG